MTEPVTEAFTNQDALPVYVAGYGVLDPGASGAVPVPLSEQAQELITRGLLVAGDSPASSASPAGLEEAHVEADGEADDEQDKPHEKRAPRARRKPHATDTPGHEGGPQNA